MKDFSTTQKKKIWYTLSALIGIGAMIGIGCYFWINPPTHTSEAFKSQLITTIVTYGGIVLLIIKTIAFFVGEHMRKKLYKQQSEMLVSPAPKQVANKKTKESKSQETISGFGFVKKQNEIIIKFDSNEFNGKEDFYNKFKYSINEYLERMRKDVHNDK